MDKNEHLYRIFDNINDWLKFAEAKILGLIAFDVALLVGYTQIHTENLVIKYASGILAIFLVLSLLLCIISVIPIVNKVAVKLKKCNFSNILFFGYIKDLNEKEFEKEFLLKLEDQEPLNKYEKDLVCQILYNSKITSLKCQFFDLASYILITGIIISIISFLILHFILT
ncbi:MAG: DUF5706 domain-containing protein [Candidatus Azobacteroides sp.]|nr:DUF5706 domain-containing protein [Candidatus Azobacteroides sp.]